MGYLAIRTAIDLAAGKFFDAHGLKPFLTDSTPGTWHLAQWHLNFLSPGIVMWPHLPQTNVPSARAIIGLNSFPKTQYGHRTTLSIITAPLATNEKEDPRIKEPSKK
ncbi:MAG: hypothetical protein WB711_20740 [Terriglobales bacterium]